MEHLDRTDQIILLLTNRYEPQTITHITSEYARKVKTIPGLASLVRPTLSYESIRLIVGSLQNKGLIDEDSYRITPKGSSLIDQLIARYGANVADWPNEIDFIEEQDNG